MSFKSGGSQSGLTTSTKTNTPPTITLLLIGMSLIFMLNVYIMSWNISGEKMSRNLHEAGIRGASMLGPDEVREHMPFNRDIEMENSNDIHADEFLWTSIDGGVTYKGKGSSSDPKWFEMQEGEVKFVFTLERVNNAKRQVILSDHERGFTLKLIDEECLVSMGKGLPFTELYSGSWTVFAGKSISTRTEELKNDDHPPYPLHSPERNSVATIMVMLASYRDPLCGNTLAEAFGNAKFPDRVRASVAQQNDPLDLDCMQEYCRIDPNCRRDQVVITIVPLEKARGVMPARFHQLSGLRDEEFCLQIDSHSAFEDDWDIIALEDWYLTENEMAVLTTYPNRAGDRHKQDLSPARCSTSFSGGKQVVHGGNSAHNVRPGKSPFLVPFFGAGVAFSKCHANLNVPYDPYMSYLFGGEEFNRAARLFTWGYDMYAPKRNFIYHYYDGDEKPVAKNEPRHREFFHGKKTMSSQTTLRWRRILGLKTKEKNKIRELTLADAELFGLGKRRTLQQYQTFSGVNLITGETESRCNKLGRMKWVPYSYSEPFHPSGRNCPLPPHKCCTMYTLALGNANRFLNLTNDEANTRLLNSDFLPRTHERVTSIKPFMNPSTYPLPCKLRRKEINSIY